MRRGWSAVCDRCGFEFKSFQLQKEWNGLMTCKECWEPRHPQDFVRVPAEEIALPWTRPEQTDVFVGHCYIDGLSCYAGFAVAGCAIAGNQRHTAEFLYDISDGPGGVRPPFIYSDPYVEDGYWETGYVE
jgi:hypothetical protein